LVEHENRLELVDPDLSKRLSRMTEMQLRAVALAVSRFAVERTGLSDAIIDRGLAALHEGRYGDPQLRSQLWSLVESLDEIQWDLQDAIDEGRASQDEYEVAFNRARAAHSVYFAQDPDALEAALEATYEANAATDDLAGLRAAVLTASTESTR
jgi:predicted transcriptional regulator